MSIIHANNLITPKMLKCSSSYKFRLFKTSHYQKISQANVYNRLRSKKIISTPLDKLSSERSYENLTKILRKSYEKFRSFVPGIFARADHFLTPRRNSRKQYFYVRFASTVMESSALSGSSSQGGYGGNRWTVSCKSAFIRNSCPRNPRGLHGCRRVRSGIKYAVSRKVLCDGERNTGCWKVGWHAFPPRFDTLSTYSAFPLPSSSKPAARV